MDSLLETQILKSIENARRNTEYAVKNSSSLMPEDELKKAISDEFLFFNLAHHDRPTDSAYAFVQDVRLDKSLEDPEPPGNRSTGKAIVGGVLVVAGQPILKKRFVMPGAAEGTSIASKLLSKLFPQKMPMRLFGTRVLGRAIGRAVPYVGWALIAIDVVELLIEENRATQLKGGNFKGFGGGSSGGGGASGSW